jgi:hypothetical protein
MSIDPRRLLEALVGDLDLCYARDRANLEHLAAALTPFRPTLRGAPAGLPFRLDAETLHSGLNFTLSTEAGDLDLLGELTGVGGYTQIAPTPCPWTSMA